MDETGVSRERAVDDAGPVAGGLGSRAHVHAILERARAAVRVAGERTATSRSVLARAAALAGVSEQVRGESVSLRAQLRTSVKAYVRHLKAEGLPAERTLVLVKSAVRDGTPPEVYYDAA